VFAGNLLPAQLPAELFSWPPSLSTQSQSISIAKFYKNKQNRNKNIGSFANIIIILFYYYYYCCIICYHVMVK